MRLLSDRRLLGALLIVAAVGAVVLLWLKPDPFAHTETVRVRFDDAGALQVIGADVRMAGTPVGKVTDKHRVGDDAVVTLELEPQAGVIHRDAVADLRPRVAFEGTAYVDLAPGSPAAPPLGDAVLPRAQTHVYVSLQDALSVADAPTRRALQGTAHSLAGALRGAPALNRSLARTPPLLRDLGAAAEAARGQGALRGAVQGYAATADAVASREQRLAPLLRDLARTATAITSPSLRATLDRLPPALAELRTGGAALRATLARLIPLARDARPAAIQLAPALRTARPLLREAGPTLRDARPLIADLRPALDAAGRSAEPARDLLTRLEPTLDTLDDSLVPALVRPTSLGIPAYLAFLNMFAGGGGSSAPFFSSGAQGLGASNGAGHFMRFGFRFLTGLGAPLPPCDLLARADQGLADRLSDAGGCTP